MASSSTNELTQLLMAWSDGDRAAIDKLMPVVYDELRKLAKRYMKRERADHTLQTTALINEAYMRLIDQNVSFKNRAHFFAISARLMRQILIDYARTRNYEKRGGAQEKIPLDDAVNLVQSRASDLTALDDALKSLAELDPQQCEIVELRFFGGLTIEETAEVLGISHATVERDWNVARAWLQRAMRRK